MLVHILRDSPNNVFKDMTSYHGLPGHQIFQANRACLRRAGKATAAVPRYRRINCADAKTMAGSSTGVISDLIKSMPRRISACIAARGGFTTY
ncbi:hypothetical protein TNCV_1716111 [Trichonephila clavipes]|nr:hypothetical protein TNCV_1716111 [Trichonephila clavipes]